MVVRLSWQTQIGVFLQIEKENDFPPPWSSEDSDTDSLGDSSEVQVLQDALHAAESRHDALQEEVAKLTVEVEKLSYRPNLTLV